MLVKFGQVVIYVLIFRIKTKTKKKDKASRKWNCTQNHHLIHLLLRNL